MERQFGEKIPEFNEVFQSRNEQKLSKNRHILEWITKNEIGNDAMIETPFGKRRVVYCDYTASARPLKDIEDYIQSEVLPLYGNTHSSVTTTSEQSTLFMHEARDVIRNATGAGEHDAVLFTGNGATAAVDELIHLMDVKQPIVVTGIHEHHSNLLPWRHITDDIFTVCESEEGQIDLTDLESTLKFIMERKGQDVTVIGCFSAASNITGIINNIEEVTTLLKRWNCLAFWDYASAAPYVNINMNLSAPKDAIYFSGHKFIGGVQTPGVLIVKKNLVRSRIPMRIGGGTVFFVSRTCEHFLKDIEYREEGGTPNMVGIVRLALAFKLKSSVDSSLIMEREQEICRRMISFLRTNDRVVLLGSSSLACHRLSVVSFLIKEPQSSLFFHHNFISVLLNDLFGIQSRAGCVCAGPYAQHLLGIDEELALKYAECLQEDSRLDRDHLRRVREYSEMEMLRPGFTRISVPYFASDEMVDFVLKAIDFVSKNAIRFITEYQLNCESGEWHHHRQRVFFARKWLGHVQFTNNGLHLASNPYHSKNTTAFVGFADNTLFTEAERLAAECEKAKTEVPDGRGLLDDKHSKLRWFIMSTEARDLNLGRSVTFSECPFRPKKYDKNSKTVSSETSRIPMGTVKTGAFINLYDQNRSEDLMKANEKLQCEEYENTAVCCFEPTKEAKSNGSIFGYAKPTVSANYDKTDDFIVSCCPLPSTSSKREHKEVEEEQKLDDDWNRRIIVKAEDEAGLEEERKCLWVVPPMTLYKKVAEAICSLSMIKDGDRVLVCLSGGKDSLSLLHLLHYHQKRLTTHKNKISFHLGAITVDPGSSGYNPKPLIDYCKALNIDYFYEEQDIIGQAAKLDECRSICAFCSRMKRG
ncbi:hypothetical protein AB6A40_006495 [Gnathostoma spinigerum]|uniref:Aminotransferase class V domain-containing protein n=1 Tax=Gnathostoma spinigerum TaxID=75299 RepID=A0ABD6EKM0_9BILA